MVGDVPLVVAASQFGLALLEPNRLPRQQWVARDRLGLYTSARLQRWFDHSHGADHGRLLGKTLALSVTCDQPTVTVFNAGTWGPVVRGVRLPYPIHGRGTVLLAGEPFRERPTDWTAAGGSAHNGSTATYNALTDGTRVLLNERILFTAACICRGAAHPPNLRRPGVIFSRARSCSTFGAAGSPTSPLTSRFLPTMASPIASRSSTTGRRSGYDNALPMHYPANAAYGGDAGMSNLVAAGARLGIRCALHENYVDYYPNYDFYTTNDTALDSASQLQLAWYNPGTHIQSFAVKPNAILPLAATQSPEIHRATSRRPITGRPQRSAALVPRGSACG